MTLIAPVLDLKQPFEADKALLKVNALMRCTLLQGLAHCQLVLLLWIRLTFHCSSCRSCLASHQPQHSSCSSHTS